MVVSESSGYMSDSQSLYGKKRVDIAESGTIFYSGSTWTTHSPL